MSFRGPVCSSLPPSPCRAAADLRLPLSSQSIDPISAAFSHGGLCVCEAVSKRPHFTKTSVTVDQRPAPFPARPHPNLTNDVCNHPISK